MENLSSDFRFPASVIDCFQHSFEDDVLFWNKNVFITIFAGIRGVLKKNKEKFSISRPWKVIKLVHLPQ